MIYSYGVTHIGTYHIEKNIVCQDAHCIKKLSDRCVIAAVADGLGSERYSDAASKMAARMSVELCAEGFRPELEESEVADLMIYAFRSSQLSIEEMARKNGHDISQYDTTLDLVIFSSGRLYYGHAGDSGIVAMLSDGTFVSVTRQKRDEMGRVFPLCFEDSWEFGVCRGEAASVFLATDGMLEILFPVLLREQPVNIYTALARSFMDRESLGFEELGEEAVRERMEEYIAQIPGEQVNDDKTVVVLCDNEVEVTPQPEEYYAVPDWERLEKERREAYLRAAYPHMYPGKEATGAKKEQDRPEPSTEEAPAETGEPKTPDDGGAGTEEGAEDLITAEECVEEALPKNKMAQKLFHIGKKKKRR